MGFSFLHLVLIRDRSDIGEFRSEYLKSLLDDRMRLRLLKEYELLFLFFCCPQLRHCGTGRVRFRQLDNADPNRLPAHPFTQGGQRLDIVGFLEHGTCDGGLLRKADRDRASFN